MRPLSCSSFRTPSHPFSFLICLPDSLKLPPSLVLLAIPLHAGGLRCGPTMQHPSSDDHRLLDHIAICCQTISDTRLSQSITPQVTASLAGNPSGSANSPVASQCVGARGHVPSGKPNRLHLSGPSLMRSTPCLSFHIYIPLHHCTHSCPPAHRALAAWLFTYLVGKFILFLVPCPPS